VQIHEKLSMTIAASDLQYVSGSIVGMGSHPRVWGMSQWGVMVTFELEKTLRRMHGSQFELDWDSSVAEAARHGGKFFDGKRNLDQVIDSFGALIAANQEVFFPTRRARISDGLRNDPSVVTDGSELLLTSISGQFMLGFPPARVVTLDAWGPHLRALLSGVGQAAASTFSGRPLSGYAAHGNHDMTEVSWWDAKLSEALPVRG
jgi:hypothetical protein